LHLLRDTLLATRPKLIVALGNIGLRALMAAARLSLDGVKLPSQAKLERAGLARGRAVAWPAMIPPDDDFSHAIGRKLPTLLWLTHPSAQNMSPYARKETLFHQRMLEARHALRRAVRAELGWTPPKERAPYPATGVYALKEWRELIGPRHEMLSELWREKGV
jgi:hypothetical protein